MKIIIAGSRSIANPRLVEEAIELSGFWISEVVSGAARGVDRCGEMWAESRGIPIKRFPAAWRDKDGDYDPYAGHDRNTAMAKYADGLIAVWDGKSAGTKHMINQAHQHGLEPFIYVYGTWVASVNLPKQYKHEFDWNA